MYVTEQVDWSQIVFEVSQTYSQDPESAADVIFDPKHDRSVEARLKSDRAWTLHGEKAMAGRTLSVSLVVY